MLKKALHPWRPWRGNPTMAQGSLQSTVAVDVIVKEFETLRLTRDAKRGNFDRPVHFL